MHFSQNNNFEQTQFWTVGVTSLRFYLYIWDGMLRKIENDFYSIFSFHCEYLRTQKLRDFFSLNKATRLSRHSFERWVCSGFKFAYFNRDAYCVREKMVFIDSSTFTANIWVLKNSKMMFFKQNSAFEQTMF